MKPAVPGVNREGCRLHTLVADVALVADGKVVLVKYRDPEQYDGESGWFLPDDGLAYLEHPQAAAKRILKEQLGVGEGMKLRLGHFESFEGGHGTWHMSWHYRVDCASPPDLAPGPTVGESRWFPLDGLPPRSEIAHHGWALQILRALRRGPE